MLEAGNYHDLAYIKRFAQYEGVPHWIVIGRLHSDEWLDRSYFAMRYQNLNGLKIKKQNIVSYYLANTIYCCIM